MNKDQLYRLILAFRDNQISDEDLYILKKYVKDCSDQELEELIDTFSADLPEEWISELQADAIFNQILANIPTTKNSQAFPSKNKTGYIAVGITAAAAILLICFKFIFNTEDTYSLAMKYAKNINPGTAKGNLLLDNGEVINLENLPHDTTITLEGYAVTKDKRGEITYTLTKDKAWEYPIYNTIITPKGGEYTLCLPDGTRIWVNADSKLRYPLNFGTSKRELDLDGEALFMVAKIRYGKKDIPFIVKTGRQTLEVLGTTFNINSYSSRVNTTLVEGSVKLSYEGIGDKILQPNQQASYSPQGNKITIKEVDPYYTIAWKSGVFAFDSMNIQSVMEILGRWYDVDIEYNRNIKDLKFTGTISKYEKIDKVLSIIEMTGDVKFKIKERRIIVM